MITTNQTHMKNIDQKFSDLMDQDLKAETLMLEVQLLLAEDFDEQMRDIAEKIKFLSQVKKGYRENINNIQRFMTQNPNTSRKDGKKYYEASPEQMKQIMGSLEKQNYDLANKTMLPPTPMMIADRGQKHSVDDDGYVTIKNDKSSTADWSNFFGEVSDETDPEEAREFASKVSDDDGNLFFYYGHTNNMDENGMPKLSVFSDQLDLMLEQIKNYMTDVEEKSEQLSVSLNQLTSQRKAALDGANQLIRKLEEVKTNTISKFE